jgi:hypothetical protein
MKIRSEKVISPIVLKYYRRPKKSGQNLPFFKCAWCFEIDNRTGGGYLDEKGKPQQICEPCAVWRFKEEHGFKTLTAAKARRRRIFDVGYLLNEMILDIYMNEKGIKRFEDCNEADRIFVKSSEIYNLLFSKEDKIKLEEMESQRDIETEISKRLISVDFGRFFSNL